MPGSRVAFCACRPRQPGTQYDRFEWRGVGGHVLRCRRMGPIRLVSRNAASTIWQTEEATI
jgi:hypothetical protein